MANNDILTPEEQRKEANARRREYYHKNKEKCLLAQKKYRTKNWEKYTQYQVQWRTKHPVQFYNSYLKRIYGIGHETVNQMYVSQGGMCAICGEKFKNKKDTHIDHNHCTKQLRQLLCHHCNTGIGHFKENTSILLRAVEYLNTWSKSTLF